VYRQRSSVFFIYSFLLSALSPRLVFFQGNEVDSVTSYAAIREVGRVRDADGSLRFTLNGQPVFMLGALDQGWWPDGLLTPPSDAAMVGHAMGTAPFPRACGRSF
jgi:hypothetical protein